MKIIQWLEQLAEPYRSQAIKNCKYPDGQMENVIQALGGAFEWESSPEGYSYWNKIYTDIDNTETSIYLQKNQPKNKQRK